MPHSEKVRISVALCTYNGERFLSKQLASILEQTRTPDEVVVCDDRSTDKTMQILTEFARRAPFQVRIIENSRTFGSTENFQQAITLCTGDLIALSDQDDIWYPSRLARSEQVLMEHPETGLVFSDADIMDDQERLLGSKLLTSVRFSARERQALAMGDYYLCVSSRFATGATVMFRADLRDTILPVGPGWIHDEWIVASVPLFMDIKPIDESLIRYRKHTSQQVGPVTSKSLLDKIKLSSMLFRDERSAREKHWRYREADLRNATNLSERFENIPLQPEGASRLAGYKGFIDHTRFRMNLPKNRFFRSFAILWRLSRYLKYGSKELLLKDLLAKA